jgi:hypothetical protein
LAFEIQFDAFGFFVRRILLGKAVNHLLEVIGPYFGQIQGKGLQKMQHGLDAPQKYIGFFLQQGVFFNQLFDSDVFIREIIKEFVCHWLVTWLIRFPVVNTRLPIHYRRIMG